MRKQDWLLIHAASETGGKVRGWMQKKGWLPESAAEVEQFDLIINLVAMGQGVSIVPQRALALYGRRRKVQRFTIPEKFTRELVILTRRNPKPPAHVQGFVENVLF